MPIVCFSLPIDLYSALHLHISALFISGKYLAWLVLMVMLLKRTAIFGVFFLLHIDRRKMIAYHHSNSKRIAQLSELI